MSQNPVGTVADEERLIELRTDDSGSFVVSIDDAASDAGIDADAEVDWRAVGGGDVPRLLVGPIDPEDREAAADPRSPTDEDGTLRVEVPAALVGEAGLGLDPDAYDADNPLLLAPDATDAPVATAPGDREPAALMDEALFLEPVRFADGTPFRDEPTSEAPEDSDPIAEAALEEREEGATPQPETVSAPIDPAVIEGVAGGSDIAYEELVSALEAIDRRDLLGLEDAVVEYGPFTVDDRIIAVVGDDKWETDIAAELDLDGDALEAARRAHNGQAETLLRDAGPDDYHHADEPYDAIVTERPTTPATE